MEDNGKGPQREGGEVAERGWGGGGRGGEVILSTISIYLSSVLFYNIYIHLYFSGYKSHNKHNGPKKPGIKSWKNRF